MILNDSIYEHIEVVKGLISLENEVTKFASRLSTAFRDGHKLLIMGNGGSAAESQHFAAEIVVRYKKNRKGLPAIALTTDSSILTATGNDYSFDEIFSRQIEALAKKGDIVLGISTSGKSINVLHGMRAAKSIGCYTIGLLGNDGGSISRLSDLPIVIKSHNTPRIQECHSIIIHIVCEILDEEFVNE
ncbi:MAG: D-sedoheptulose 7-phosphate isomerase [Spirochaetota bacterium]|nr:D-sedoheptulose 7-phosphate isomerase [Spirochaetota bacterium]